MTRSSVDLPQPGRPDERDELARLELELDVLECGDVALRERLRHALDLDDTHATFSGARRTIAFSARTTSTKKAIPRNAAITSVAHSSCGSIE